MTLMNSRHPISIWLLVICLAGYAYYVTRQNFRVWHYNNLIEHPQDIADNYSDLPPEVIFAKARYMNAQGDYQQALRAYAQIARAGSRSFQLRVQYNMGTIYLQQAAKLWQGQGVWEYKQINTLLDLAEQSFKSVLFAEPEHWPARYNLEYALRIRPPAKEEEEANWKRHKRSVFAIMPGIPGGGP
jgi:mxaK protein